ncbi:MAG TPA: hypothetical protein VKT82_15645 [Ktedonobacterales bacterium]|nr:hypothetical protein [Ktedonobacterales bacterium]
MNGETQRLCKNPGCQSPLPPPKPGRKARLTCSDDCRKAASRAHLREEARRREEEALLARRARWQAFQPTTRSMLSRVEALGGAALAEALAEAIRRERERPNVTADLAAESGTILAKRLEALYQRLLTLRARAVRYRMTDREERALETLLSLAVDACWLANPELTDEEKGGKP